MVAIMKDVEAIKKEKTNTSSNFKYRGIDDVMNSLHEAFSKHGVFITTEVLNRIEVERVSAAGKALFYVTITVRFTFNASDGSFITSTIYGTAMDSSDKADNKCLSIALKYCLLQSFLIPTEDMQEPDSQSHEVKPKVQASKVITATPAPQQAKATPSGPIKMTDHVWEQYITRLNAGEHLAEKIKKAFILTAEQQETLTKYEPIQTT